MRIKKFNSKSLSKISLASTTGVAVVAVTWIAAIVVLAFATVSIKSTVHHSEDRMEAIHLPAVVVSHHILENRDYLNIINGMTVSHDVMVEYKNGGLHITAKDRVNYDDWMKVVSSLILEGGVDWRVMDFCAGSCLGGNAYEIFITGFRLRYAIR